MTLTPAGTFDLSGFVARNNPSTGVHDAIEIRALYVNSGQAALIISVGVLGFTPHHALELRHRVAKILGISGEMVMLAATHTHSAPATMPLNGCGQVDERWIRQLEDAIIDCARAAAENAQPVRMGAGQIHVPGMARNRRESDGLVDWGLACLKVESVEGELLGIVGNYACHPVVLGAENGLVSNDYPGAFIRHLEDRGIAAVFLTGACGDINPVSRGDFAMADSMGAALGDAALEYANRVDSWQAPVVGGARDFRIEWELATRAELDQHRLRLEGSRPAEVVGSAARVYAVYREWLDRHTKRPHEWPKHLDVTLQVIGIGPVRLVGLPGEIFCATGLDVKSHLGVTTFVSGYTNGNMGYVPTDEAYPKGGYEVSDAHRYYGYPGVVKRGTAERMASSVKDLADRVL